MSGKDLFVCQYLCPHQGQLVFSVVLVYQELVCHQARIEFPLKGDEKYVYQPPIL